MPNPSRTRATKNWTPPEWIELPGNFIEPIYFKTFPTDTVGKVFINLRRGEKIKRVTLHAFDPSSAMQELVAIAAVWDYELAA